MRLSRVFYKAVHPLYSRARSHRLTIYFLFRVSIPRGYEVHWDSTTLMLRRCLSRLVTRTDAVFEMGVGQAALLSIWTSKKLAPASVEGVDVSPSRVDSASKIIAHNNCRIKVWQSDLFSNVRGEYDLIFFNPPYVRTSVGRELDLTKRLNVDGDQVWDGGEMGTTVISAFLADAFKYLKPSGGILIGIQDYYVKKDQISDLANRYGYNIVDICSSWINPSVVYFLKANRE